MDWRIMRLVRDTIQFTILRFLQSAIYRSLAQLWQSDLVIFVILDFALRNTEIEYLYRKQSKSLVGDIVRLIDICYSRYSRLTVKSGCSVLSEQSLYRRDCSTICLFRAQLSRILQCEQHSERKRSTVELIYKQNQQARSCSD